MRILILSMVGRRIKYSVQSLFVFIAVVSALMIMVSRWYRCHGQRLARIELEAIGAEVDTELLAGGDRFIPGCGGRIVSVNLENANAQEIQRFLSVAGRLPHLESLVLRNADLHDTDLRKLTDLGSLRVLDISGTSVSDRGVARLAAVGSVTALDLSFTNVGDIGLRAIGLMKNLEILSIARTRATADGLVHLSGHQRLRYLQANGLELQGIRVSVLRRMHQLRVLEIDDTGISSEERAKIRAELPNVAFSFWER